MSKPLISSDQLNGILYRNFKAAGYRFKSTGQPDAPREVFSLVNGIVVDLFEALGVNFVQINGED